MSAYAIPAARVFERKMKILAPVEFLPRFDLLYLSARRDIVISTGRARGTEKLCRCAAERGIKMKLKIGNVIRDRRRTGDMTQEQLAERLGVSPQAVSRWEIGTAYPDLELLPVLAGMFGVTLEELLGDRREERIEAYRKSIEDAETDEEQIVLCRAAFAEFPNEFSFARRLCMALNRDRSNYGEVIRISKDALGRCFVGRERWWFMRFIVLDGDDGTVYDFLDENIADSEFAATSPMRRGLIRQRYRFRGEETAWARLGQFDRIQNILSAANAAPSINEIEAVRASLDYINALVGVDEAVRREHPVLGDGVPDLWFEPRVINGLRLSNRLGNAGRTDEALAILEETTEVFERFFALPTGAVLSYRLGGQFDFDAAITNEDHTVTAAFKERIGLEKPGRAESLPPIRPYGFIECVDTDVWDWSGDIIKSARFDDCVGRMRRAAGIG